MSSKKTMKIAFVSGGIIPASEVKQGKSSEDDLKVSPHEEVVVSERYGKQLVQDKFAYVVVPKKAAAKKKSPTKKEAKEEKAKQEKEKTLADAEGEVKDAEEALTSAENDNDKVAAQELLDAAQAKLQNLSDE